MDVDVHLFLSVCAYRVAGMCAIVVACSSQLLQVCALTNLDSSCLASVSKQACTVMASSCFLHEVAWATAGPFEQHTAFI